MKELESGSQTSIAASNDSAAADAEAAADEDDNDDKDDETYQSDANVKLFEKYAPAIAQSKVATDRCVM